MAGCEVFKLKRTKDSCTVPSSMLTCEGVVVQSSVPLMACTLKMPLSSHWRVLKRFVTKLAVVALRHLPDSSGRGFSLVGVVLVTVLFRTQTGQFKHTCAAAPFLGYSAIASTRHRRHM